MKSKPQNWYIIGLKLADENVVSLGSNHEYVEPTQVFCTQSMAEAIACKWTSLVDPTNTDKPLFDEVTVVKGSAKFPFFASKGEIVYTAQPRHFEIAGVASTKSAFAMLQESILKNQGKSDE